VDTVAIIALMLLSVVGYSAGVVLKTGKSIVLKPHILDLFLVVVIWSGALTSKLTMDVNKWLLILIWFGTALVLGIGSKIIWKREAVEITLDAKFKKITANPLKRFWLKWNLLVLRMGGFQARIFLSIFFFLFIAPFAFMIKIFSDPLRIKDRSFQARWIERAESKLNLESFRRQF
jgi:hypothetical protein